MFTMTGTVFAASDLEIIYHLTCEDFTAEEIQGGTLIKVPTGTVVEVTFLIENKAGEDFSLSALQNEIKFDNDFFEFQDGSGKTEFEDLDARCALREYSSGNKYVYANCYSDINLEKKQKFATFKLRVAETQVGARGEICSGEEIAYVDAQNKVGGIEKSDLTVEIIEGDPAIPMYSISYVDTNGEPLHTESNILRGSKTNLRISEEKDGYTLDGWIIDGQTYPPGYEITVNKNITAMAVWKAKSVYAVSFDTNGGTSVGAITGNEGATIVLDKTTTKSGYTFAGWYLESDFKTKVTSVTLTNDITVYAKWDKNESTGGGGGGGGGGTTQKHTITFKTPDGIELDKIERTKNSTVDLTKYKYDKEGYTFEGWYTEKELTNKVTSVVLTEDVTFFAKWVEGSAPVVTPGAHPEILTTEHYAYIVGRDGNMICPQDNITRAEVATIFFRLLTEEIRNENLTRENGFTDVSSDDWFSAAVSTLSKLEIIKGRTETTFEPNAPITRAEFTTIAARFSDREYSGPDFFTDTDGHWAEAYINTAASLGWIVGENGIFRPNDNITRAEVMTLANRVLGRIPESQADLLEGMTKWVDNADTNAWYYLAVQEATNSHEYEKKADGVHEKWTQLTENPDWTQLEK